MKKIANPQELQNELRRILAATQGPEKPSRVKLSAELRVLANRVASAKWVEMHRGSEGNRWMLKGEGGQFEYAIVEERESPQGSIYVVILRERARTSWEYRRKQYRNLDDAQKVAERWLELDKEGAQIQLGDFSRV